MPMADLNSVGFVEKHFYHISPSLQTHFRLQIDDMWWVTNSSRKIWQMHCNEQKEDREGALCMTSLRFTMFPIQQILVPQTICCWVSQCNCLDVFALVLVALSVALPMCLPLYTLTCLLALVAVPACPDLVFPLISFHLSCRFGGIFLKASFGFCFLFASSFVGGGGLRIFGHFCLPFWFSIFWKYVSQCGCLVSILPPVTFVFHFSLVISRLIHFLFLASCRRVRGVWFSSICLLILSLLSPLNRC